MGLLYSYFGNRPLHDRICALHVWARDASMLALRSTNTPLPRPEERSVAGFCTTIRVFCAAMVVSFTSSLVGAEADNCSDAVLRVGSYNIRVSHADRKTQNAWEKRKGDLVALMRRIDYDVVGLQESFTEQSAYITNSLPDYALIGSIEGAEESVGVTSPICYRKARLKPMKSGAFWLSKTPDAPGGDVWDAWSGRKVCVWAILKDRVSGKMFCFMNTHTDHKGKVARLEGTKLIMRRMADIVPAGTPVVFTGDHNCRETEAPSQAVMKVLKNALYVAETPPVGPWRTFSGWKWREKEYPAVDAIKLPANIRNSRKGSPDADMDKDGRHKWEDCGARIDYVYVSDGVKVKSYATRADTRPGTKLYPSDHFPLVATIELPMTRKEKVK